MFRNIKLELKRALYNKLFLFSIIIGITICIIAIYPYMKYSQEYSFVEAWMRGIGMGKAYFVLFSPLLSGLPYSGMLVIERNNGFLKYVYSRMNKKNYLISKGIANAIVGGLTIFIPSIILIIITRNIFTVPQNINIHTLTNDPLSYMLIRNPNKYLIIYCFWMFFQGVLWATIAYTMSLVLRNAFLIVVLPFLFSIISSFLLSMLGRARIAFSASFAPYLVENASIISMLVYPIIMISLSIIIVTYYNIIKENCYE